MQAFGEDRVQVDWKPFVIDPGTHVEGESVESYCRRRWGSSGWTHHLQSEGRKDGANFGTWTTWPNTWKAHQLIQFCRTAGGMSTDRVNQVLFHAEYEEGRNISQVETLLQLAREELGIVQEDVLESLRTYLSQDQGKQQVQDEIRSGRARYGIRGVPFFIVRGKDPSKRPHGFSGARSSDTFLELFEEVADDNDNDIDNDDNDSDNISLGL